MNNHGPILCVDDDPGVLASLKLELSPKYQIVTAQTLDQAKEMFETHKPGVVIIDVHLDQDSGLVLLADFKRRTKHVHCLMLTADRNSQSISKAIKLGASDYITKPFEKEDLQKTLNKYVSPKETVIYDAPQEKIAREYLGRSENVQRLRKLSQKVANAEVNILIMGESGTGKEVLSRYIHSLNTDSKRPFVALNCAAIPSELMESTLFGHEKGSFTGADQRKVGKFELANGGDIFLDEIGSMPIQLQSKLLRVLQEREFERVGGNETIQSNFRVIAATNRNLQDQINEGTFREDLYYRLSVVQFYLEPLRKRREDIPLLVDYYLKNSFHNIRNKTISAETKARLSTMEWPGNARQLFNILDSMIVLSDQNVLQIDDIPNYILDIPKTYSQSEQLPIDKFEKALDEYEMKLIQNALDQSFGQKQKASKALNISRSSLIRRMKRLKMME